MFVNIYLNHHNKLCVSLFLESLEQIDNCFLILEGFSSEEESVTVETEVEKVGTVTNPVHDGLPSMLDNILSDEPGDVGKEIGIAADGDLKKEVKIEKPNVTRSIVLNTNKTNIF